ncbi:hypothetical protein FXF51_30900 [Nonomuraea sp. PA05]|uniref:hypothetical protein n=1 Tax=Nonomuraea sp. PA05 TaxID=2604466 RepID=UPI0011D5D241|nr:hypothetical protein [Nonomuraea sp. PA05]TYB60628.1 hypothetical protein FXF51_30900 [Nonomuraea sp. PA05]
MTMVQVRLPPEASLADALRLLGLSEQDADVGYGLVAVVPGLQVLRVTEEAARRLIGDLAAGRVPRDLVDVFSDPRVEPQEPEDR